MSQDVPNAPSPADDNPFQPQRVRGANNERIISHAIAREVALEAFARIKFPSA